MKNLILTGCMLLSFAFVSAQQTPQQSKTKTDTVHSQKSKHGAKKGTTTTSKDTVSKQTSQQKRKSKNAGTAKTSQQRDSISGTKTP